MILLENIVLFHLKKVHQNTHGKVETMFLNHPVTRLANYFAEDDFWHKRWVPTLLPDKVREEVVREVPMLLPEDRSQRPKTKDPEWRNKWKWVLLASQGNIECCPHIVSTMRHPFVSRNIICRDAVRKLNPLRTRLFAMRVGPSPTYVVTIDKKDRVYVPAIFKNLSDDKPIILPYAEMRTYVDSINFGDVTFI